MIQESVLKPIGAKRGRKPSSEECPQIFTKPNPSRWMTKEVAVATLGVTVEKLKELTTTGRLRPAKHKGQLYVSVESVLREKSSGDSKPPPVEALVINDRDSTEVAAPTPYPFPEKPGRGSIGVSEKSDTSREAFFPKKLSPEITVSPQWISGNKKDRVSPNDDMAIKLVEYAPGEFGYSVEDVARAIHKNPVVVRNLISGLKVEADLTGRYVKRKSLKEFFKRSRGGEIRDIF